MERLSEIFGKKEKTIKDCVAKTARALGVDESEVLKVLNSHYIKINVEDLPPEVIVNILSGVDDPKDLASLMKTSRKFGHAMTKRERDENKARIMQTLSRSSSSSDPKVISLGMYVGHWVGGIGNVGGKIVKISRFKGGKKEGEISGISLSSGHSLTYRKGSKLWLEPGAYTKQRGQKHWEFGPVVGEGVLVDSVVYRYRYRYG
jgi:hypothetical protein